MKKFSSKRNSWAISACLILSLALSGRGLSAPVGNSVKHPHSASCTAPEFHQFDFWIGNWEAFNSDRPSIPVARNDVSRILAGCVIHEDYQAVSGLHGESFTMYEAPTKRWRQIWVTNHGEWLVLQGGLQNGKMILQGIEHTPNGSRMVRGEWIPESYGVRETATTSSNGGKTWDLWFDLMFRRAASTADSESVQKNAVLDDEYQHAVKVNDAAVMDRTLSDNCSLVTGDGKKYTKADLLQKARKGDVHYLQQDATRRTIRIQGDTAVVTADLWD
jgi:hypothetical protein